MCISYENITFELLKKTIVDMRRLLFLPLFLLAITVHGKTSVVPTYRSFVYWIQGKDTLYCENNTLLLESVSPDSSIVVRVRHEDWQNTVNDRKMARLAPWHAAMSRCRGIRAIVHQGKANTDAMMPMEKSLVATPNACSVEGMTRMTEHVEMNLACEYMIENTGDKDVVINDLNRGLVWHVPARTYLLLNMGCLPQACLLRIANMDSERPEAKYVTIGGGSFSMKLSVAYEDDYCWIFLLDEEVRVNAGGLDFSRMTGLSSESLRTHFVKVDKDTFQETPMIKDEVFAIIKKAKEDRKRGRKK